MSVRDAVVEVELDRHPAPLGGVIGDPRIAAAVGEPHRRAYRFPLHVRGAREPLRLGRRREAAGAQRSPRVRRAVAGVRAGDVVDRVDDLFGKSVGHGQTLSARAYSRCDAPPPPPHDRPPRPSASGRAHRGPDALAAPRPARGRDPAGHHREGALADLRAAGARRVVNLLFPLRAGEAEELHRFGAALSARRSRT